ncbi:MAG: hypothetical protein H7X99_03080, partial [Saprospiraceae bacterium]|nr:hypothetical protein [Saprospiraceae bacterium]
RPGQSGRGSSAADMELMKADLKVIKEGGYNAIRTWGSYSEDQLKLVQHSGLKLIMGIGIDPKGKYGDPAFISACEDKVKKIMNYAKNYDCIITYLVLNEPQTDHIYKMSGLAFVNLMKNMMDIIHKEHPGIPVTISANAMISDFINENIFDVYAYNCYDHNEAQTATMGFKDYIKGLCQLNGLKKPFIATEFGYSVSQVGTHYYGGNTLTEQSTGLIANYRDLIDAGAVGMCPFQYADGWWKADDPNVHNAREPEEWFGFWGYSNLQDRFGSPRPVWYALRNYMKALIISPKNKEIYITNKIPLEVYTDKYTKKVLVKLNDKVVYSKEALKEGYFADHLMLAPNGIEDMELSFEFYDKDDQLIKTESILILDSEKKFDLPKLSIEVTPGDDLNAGKIASVKIHIESKENFKLEEELKVSFNTHLGWEIGPQMTISLKDQLNNKTIDSESFFTIPANCWIANASAGVTVRYGKFTFKIHDQKLIFRGDWANEVGRKEAVELKRVNTAGE